MCRKNLAVQPVRLASGTAAIALLLMLATPAGVASAADLSPAPADAALDSDGDGISDVDEINRYGTNHRVADTDSEHVYAGVVQARRLLLRHDAIIRLAVSDDDGHFDDTVAHLFIMKVDFFTVSNNAIN